jgi:hypothetical protein
MIEKRKLQSGRHAYRVRWREAGRGSREHVRSFDRREDALRFETDLRRRKQLGELAETDTGHETLDEWAREWFESYAQPNLAGHTLAYYARAWDIHVLPRLGELELRQLTPAVVAGFADELRRDGAGDPDHPQGALAPAERPQPSGNPREGPGQPRHGDPQARTTPQAGRQTARTGDGRAAPT